MTASEHTKYRQSKEWKEFRKKIIEERTAVCELCGTKYSGKRIKQLQLHHLDPANYENLTSEKFKLICASDHKLVERISKKLQGKNELKNKELWIALLQDFLPIS